MFARPADVEPLKKEAKEELQPGVVVPAEHKFVEPIKAVKVPNDMQMWEKSEAYFEYLGFIMAVNEAVKGTSLSSDFYISNMVIELDKVLSKIDKLIDETPPIDQPQRFGNKAFRTWCEKLGNSTLLWLQEALPVDMHHALPEIVVYLNEGFGNATRIDYGTGHEIAFIMFLICLYKIGALDTADYKATGNKVFFKYLEIVRKLQITYRMEPAGSHGVWSLDDHQFVPFIWGSAQLIDHPQLEPQHFVDPEIVAAHSGSFLFISCINHIMKVKIGPFAEHSNQLWGISGVSTWTKVNSGLIKMYKAEVLAKFPVVQHILFGSLLAFSVAKTKVIHPHRLSVSTPLVKKYSSTELPTLK